VSVVEVLPPEQTNETHPDNINNTVTENLSGPLVSEECEVCSASRSSQNGPSDVLDSRNEGGTIVTQETQNETTPSCHLLNEPKSFYLAPRDRSTDALHNASEASEVSPSKMQLFM
jgi:hypothetical protein